MKQRSALTNTTNSMSFVGDMSSSAGRSFSGFCIDQDRAPYEKSDDDVRHSHNSIYSSYATESFSSENGVERRKIDYQSDIKNNDLFFHSDRRHKISSHFTKLNDLDNYDQRGRKYRSRSSEYFGFPCKTTCQQSSRGVNSVKRRSESRSVSPDRN